MVQTAGFLTVLAITHRRVSSLENNLLLLGAVTLHCMQPHYIWVTGVMPRSFIPLARTKRAAWKRRSRAWKTRIAVSVWYCCRARRSSQVQPVSCVRTVHIPCPHAGHWDLDTHNLSTDTPMLVAFTPAVGNPLQCQQRTLLSTKACWKGASSPFWYPQGRVTRGDACKRNKQWLESENLPCTTGCYSLRILLESLLLLCLS